MGKVYWLKFTDCPIIRKSVLVPCHMQTVRANSVLFSMFINLKLRIDHYLLWGEGDEHFFKVVCTACHTIVWSWTYFSVVFFTQTIFISFFQQNLSFYMKPELDVPINTEWQITNQSQVCLMRFDHCPDLFRGELSKNQVILWKDSPEDGDHWWSLWRLHDDKSLVLVLRSVIGDWSHITMDHYGYVTCFICM